MATCLLIGLILTLNQAVRGVHKYDVNDLVIVNGTCDQDYQHVGICLELNKESAKIGFFKHCNKSGYVHVSYHCLVIPTKMLRAFKVRESRSMHQVALGDKDAVHVYESYLSFMAHQEHQCINRKEHRCIQNSKQLLFGLLAHKFEVKGLYYFFNTFMKPSGFD